MFRPSIRTANTTVTYLNRRLQSTFQNGDLKKFVIAQYTQNQPKYDAIEHLPAWQRMLGERVISLFKVDMDRTRSGPIAARQFRDMCRAQGSYHPGSSELTSPHEQFYYGTLNMPRTFQQAFQIQVLHIWMLFVRLRRLPRKYCREYQSKLINSTFEELGHRMRQDIKVTSESIINTNKKHMNEQLRGAIFAYDEGVYLDDTTLGAAIWRNLFNGEQDTDIAHIEQMVHYVRTQLYIFDQVSDKDFANGQMQFLDPWLRYDVLNEEDQKQIKQVAAESRREMVENPKPSQGSVLSEEGW